ncbi:non-specific serine/threonine protein kinase [Ranunculus cassubicifolius]
MKSFLLWFLFIIISIASAQLLNPTNKSLAVVVVNNNNGISMPNIHLKKQAQRIIAHPNGTILYEGNYGRSSWSFEIGSSLSSLYQAVPDGAVAPYLPGSVIIDIGDGFVQTNDFNKLNLMEMLDEYFANLPLITKDEVIVGEKQTTVKVLDASNGSLLYEFGSGALPRGENNDPTENSAEEIFITLTKYTLNNFDRISKKMLWSITLLGVQADLHFQDEVMSVPAFRVFYANHVQALLKTLGLDYKERELPRITNKDRSNTSVAIASEIGSNSTSIAVLDGSRNMSSENKNFGFLGNASFQVLCISVALLVCVPCLIQRMQQSSKKQTDLGERNSVITKRKKARKLGSNRKSPKTVEKNTVLSPEEGENLEGNTSIVKDVESWFQLGIREEFPGKGRTVGKLFISNVEIAKGSNGTVVLEGRCDGRPVAVKRLVQAHHDVAHIEIQNLIASDRHPNIVRWYGVEWDSDFVYLSLERCTCSLNDLIRMISDASGPSMLTKDNGTNSLYEFNINLDSAKELLKNADLWKANGHPSAQLIKLMREVVAGVAHLHDLGIIHRDLKPQNILITNERSLCAKISDMGISKRLVGDQASLGHHPTGYGSSGWQAPEQLLNGRQTRAVDLFSLGCVLFYCMTGGKHPFGDQFERDTNIVKNRVDLFLVDHIPEALDIISRLLDPEPESRPAARDMLSHPLFWSSETRLSFLRDASDRVELEDRETDSAILEALENVAPTALGGNWDTKLETSFLSNIGRYRRYKFDSVRDLLRVIRNKLNHYRELPTEIQELLGSVSEGFDGYFAIRFPRFLIEVYKVIREYCKEEELFEKYFNTDLV